MSECGEDLLSEEEKRLLLRIARDSLARFARDGKRLRLDAYALTERLREKRGAFVTLRNKGALRGCIGYTRSTEALAEAVRDNAINAAGHDPRFSPVTRDELDEITIEISALSPGDTPGSPFIRVKDIEEISVGRDGLYLENAGPRGGGLLLPQVAVEQGWDVGDFLAGLCRKAGAEDGAWESDESVLYRFTAQVFSEPAG